VISNLPNALWLTSTFQIIGAPVFFPTVWGWIKRWFDPITTSKIFIISDHNVLKTLSTFIEPANIPKKYGGELDYAFGMPPILDPAEEQHVVWANSADVSSRDKWPQGPMKWIPGENGTMTVIAVGSVDGKERREKVATFYPDGKEGTIVGETTDSSVGGTPADTVTVQAQPQSIPRSNSLTNGAIETKLPLSEQPIEIELANAQA
jgi:hypothetical protein